METVRGEDPIFIVGAPRSGTTLLAAMLAAHTRLSCGPETRFFRFLAETDSSRLFESWPENAVDFLFSIVLMDSVPTHYGLTREQIRAYLEQRTPSVPTILSSLTEQFMWREGKCRWVEKSPEHLMQVKAIRQWFPQSPIIRIIRDPRDIALSMTKTPWAPQDFLEALMFWRKYDEQSAEFFRSDENSYTFYYENLIQSPETELERLCAFIGEEYEPRMLDTSRSADRVVTEQETWKNLVYKSVDETRIHVWKRELPKERKRIAEALVGERLIAYGYECSERLDSVANVYPSLDALLQHREALSLLVAKGVRFWHDCRNEKDDWMIYVGDPDEERWLSYEKPERWWNTLHLMAKILKERMSHTQIYWVRERNAKARLGYCSRLLAFAFQLAGDQQVTRS